MKIPIQVWSEITRGEMFEVPRNSWLPNVHWSNGFPYIVEVI